MRRTGSVKGAKKRADVAFSKIVRSRGKCEAAVAGTMFCVGPHQCAHIISRRFSNTRCVEGNAWNLCAGHHHRLTDHPDEHMTLVALTIGMDRFYDLKALALSHRKVDWFVVAAELEARLKEIEG
jgi:hypothetical protein